MVIFVTQFTEMKFRSYLPILILFYCLSGCQESKQIVQNKNSDSIVLDTFPKIQPYFYTNKNYKADQNKIDTIASFYKKNWQKNKLSGSFLVAQKGKILFEGYSGYSDFKSKDTIDANTPIHLASVSKMITAAAIIKLIDEGKLKLDQKVNTILKNFQYPEITIRMLLNHRSGLTNYAYYFDDRSIWDHRNFLKNQDILDIFIKNDVSLDFRPDTKFTYCNTNYVMLALIIEKVTGLRFDQALHKMIFEPLEMENTKVAMNIDDVKRFSQSYKSNFVLHHLDHLDGIYGDKNIYSTPRDLLKFDNAISNPDFVNSNLLKDIYRGYSYERKGKRNYGLGIRLLEYDNGSTLFYHNGWWHGNTSSLVKLKSENVVIIALSNKYTTIPYRSFILSSLFGNYPLEIKNKDLID